MLSAIELCKIKCFRFKNTSFPLPLALLVFVAFILIAYFYIKKYKNSYFFLVTIRQFTKNAKVKVKRVLRVIKDRPEYMNNFLLVLNSLLFGLGSWIAITGLWLEVPVLIHHLPEGWHLASYLTFAIQLANIAPLIYWYLNRKYSKYCNEVSGTNLQLFIGVLASIILIFYWETKIFIFGDEHSVVLLVCAFLLSIVDCLSSVTFLPFMARFRSVYLTPYLIGEGLSGFLPTILALLQNAEDNYNPPDIYNIPTENLTEDLLNSTTSSSYNITNPSSSLNSTIKNIELSLAFGPDVFFVSLLVTIIISWLAFWYLQFHQPNQFERRNSLPRPIEETKKTAGQALSKYILGYDKVQRKQNELEWEKRKQLIINTEKLNKDVKRIVKQNQHLLKENSHVTILQSSNSAAIDAISTASFTAIKSSSKPLIKDNYIQQQFKGNCISNDIESNNVPARRNRRSSKSWDKEKLEYYYLLFLIFFACTINFGLLPPLQPFSCLPVSHSTLKYTVILSGLSYPFGCSLALFFKCRSTKMLTLLTLLATLITSFIFYSALHSPYLPPFMQKSNSTQGELLLIDYNDSLNSTEWENDYYNNRDESTSLKRFWMHFDNHQSKIFSVLMIFCWVTFIFILSYVKTMITIILNDKNGQEALFYVGLCSQTGSVLGAVCMFVTVNYFNWFNSKAMK